MTNTDTRMTPYQHEINDVVDELIECGISHGFNMAMGRNVRAKEEAERFEEKKAEFKALVMRAVPKEELDGAWAMVKEAEKYIP